MSSQLISRVAATYLASLPKQAADVEYEDSVSGPKVRIRWSARNDRILIEEIPGKGQRKVRRARYTPRGDFGYRMPSALLSMNIIHWMRPSASMTYDSAISAFKSAIEEAIKVLETEDPGLLVPSTRRHLAALPTEEVINSLMVEPTDYSPIEVVGKDFKFEAKWDVFRVYSPGSDFHQSDPHYTGITSKSPLAARRLYLMLKVNPNLLSNLKYSELWDWFVSMRISVRPTASNWS